MSMTAADRQAALTAALKERILILDGGAGTMIQKHKLTEADYRGERFADWAQDVGGNNDLLNLTRPDIIRDMHTAYLEAGADIIETNTFSATTIAQADYGMQSIVEELNIEGARLAREAADAISARDGKPRFVAGAMGPTNRTASLSPDVNDPGARNTDFGELEQAYREAAIALLEGGVDMFLIETITDTLNCRAALFAIDALAEERGTKTPIMISVTVPDQSGRTLSGQTVEAFWNSIRHAEPISIGVNCALGPDLMRPHIADLSGVADTHVSAYPNAGLPNAFGEYDETPESMASHIGEWARSGLLNIVGGCCGTTPDHIAAFAEVTKGVAPRAIPEMPTVMRLSGLEAVAISS